ncbi:MAG: alginate lyase family protein, partial [Rickettsiales bacterium]|nr:alginate lyase family protein [Rickettsiales bacterium]
SKIRDNINKDIAQAKNSTFANHRYWLGFGVGAAGVATNNDAFFQWGIESARVGLREVQPDGSLPREMNRASRARDYHIFAVAPLVMMAELGMANGINLYDETDGALHKLVKRILASDRDTSFYERRTGKKQIPYPDGNDGIPSSRLGWLEPYYARFPSQEALSILKNKRSVSSTALGGNMTLIYTGKDE